MFQEISPAIIKAESKKKYLDLVIGISREEEIMEARYIPFDLSAANVRLVIKDIETEEVVQYLYWTDGQISSFPDLPYLF